MGADLEVKVLRGPGRRDPSEAQGSGREAGAGGSVARIRGLTNRNRDTRRTRQGERARDRDALATASRERQSGSRAVKVSVLTRGGLALHLKG